MNIIYIYVHIKHRSPNPMSGQGRILLVVYNPRKVDRIWGIWGSHSNLGEVQILSTHSLEGPLDVFMRSKTRGLSPGQAKGAQSRTVQ